jgi:hypothetical protein
MSFEFELVPLTESGRFTPDDILQMRAWWERFPGWTGPDGVIFVFENAESRELRLERWRKNPSTNDYLTPYIKFFDDSHVQLSVVGDDTDQWFHDFAVWCQQRWPCELRYFGQPVPAEDLVVSATE